jgi:hypothetical protein
VARCEGVRAARRTRRLLRWALAARAGAWHVAALVPGGNRALRRERARAFAQGAATVAAVDPASTEPPVVPEWPHLQRPRAGSR